MVYLPGDNDTFNYYPGPSWSNFVGRYRSTSKPPLKESEIFVFGKFLIKIHLGATNTNSI